MFIVLKAEGGYLCEAYAMAKGITTFEEAQKLMEDDMLKDLDEMWDGPEHDGEWDDFVAKGMNTNDGCGYLFEGDDGNLPEWRIMEV